MMDKCSIDDGICLDRDELEQVLAYQDSFGRSTEDVQRIKGVMEWC